MAVESAADTVLFPGATHSHTVQWTAAGPVSMHVVTAPRPGGLYALQPVLSNAAVLGRETVSSIQRRMAPETTSVGINGDRFTWEEGVPTGLLVQGGMVAHQSHPGRSSIGVDAAGTLQVARVSTTGFWRGTGIAHPVQFVNERPPARNVALFTPAWGARTPDATDTIEVVLQPLAPPRPGVDLVGTVTGVIVGGGTAIPPDGAVLVAGGGKAAELLWTEALVGAQVTLRLTLKPEQWNGVVEAIGGGPELVRNGAPVLRWDEDLTPEQLLGRDPRAAVGQRRNGSIVLVAVDGRQPQFSVGITNADLARTLVRLGCVTGAAVDAGGSVTIAFDGKVLNRPSDSYGERPVAEALLVTYAGVYAPPVPAVLSPDGDRRDDTQRFSYKLVRPSSVTVQLYGPDGVGREIEPPSVKSAGTYVLPWSARTADGLLEAEGRWRWHVEAADDLGRRSSIDRTFSVNTTLGYVAAPRSVARRRPATISFRLTRSARIRVTIETTSGEIYRTVATGVRGPGRVSVRWNGRDARNRPLARGTWTIRVAATNVTGVSQFRLPLAIR
jgi:hypothetical protein